MRFLKQNTATRVTVGPFMDKTDGVTPETSLTVTNCKLTLMVDDAGVPTLVLDAAATASAGDNDMVHVTNDDAGFYDLELTAAQTNYVGRAILSITDAANHCPVFHEFMILPANVYDSWLGTDTLDVQVTGIANDAITAAAIADGAINAATFASDVDAEILSYIVDDATRIDASSLNTAAVTSVPAIKTKTDYLPSATAGSAGGVFIAGSNAATTVNITGTVSGNSTHSAADVWSVAARTLTAIDEDSTTLDLDGTIRGALGMSTANLDTQISTLATAAALAAAKAILDKFNTMVVLDGAVYDFTSDALAAAPGGTGSDPLSSAVPGAYAAGTAGYVIGTYLDAAISGVGGAVGSGADSVTVTWTSEGNPVADGDVWITTDSAGNNVIAGTLQTNTSGEATFQLDAGEVYYMWGQRSGVNSLTGIQFTAVAD